MAQPLKPFSSLFPPPPLFTFVFFLILFVLGFYTFHHPKTSANYPSPPPQNPQTTLSSLFLSSASNSTISSYLRHITSQPHLAGTKPSLHTSQYVQIHFQFLNLKTHKTEYSVLLSYPAHASLSAHFSNGTSLNLDLTEPGTSGLIEPVPVWPYHAYSPSGSVKGEVVFANYGREEDYHVLEGIGVHVSGRVILVRKGNLISRVKVVEIAEAKRALGVLTYSEDVNGDGNGGVERGTVMRGLGDPLSPGWASVEGGERLRLGDSEVLKRFPKITSLPLSRENAEVILGSLEGELVPEVWRKGSGRVKFERVGPGPTVVNLTYEVGWCCSC